MVTHEKHKIPSSDPATLPEISLLCCKPQQEETIFGLVNQQEVSTEVGQTVIHGSAAQDMDEALYLLLDLRDEADFEDCHIATAICYPHTQVTLGLFFCYVDACNLSFYENALNPPPWQLTHSTNYFSSEIYRYKNRPDRMIIIYDDDERISSAAGKLFVERGVENVYVLTGGLRKFSDKHEDFVTGTPPQYAESCPPSTARSSRPPMTGGSRRPPMTGRSSASSRPPMTGRSGVSMASGAGTQRSHGAPSLSMR